YSNNSPFLWLSGDQSALTNVTISGNRASVNGGGISNQSGSVDAHPRLSNTILAGNTGGIRPDLSGRFTSGGHNLIGNATGVFFAGGLTTGDLAGTAASPIDPLLAPLG